MKHRALMMARRRPMASAFTLIELLVVITIIVVLLALLTPGLDRALAAAASARCMANQRGTAQAMRFYAGDYRGHVMPISNEAGKNWFHKLASYIGHPNGPRGFYEGEVKMLDCPEADTRWDPLDAQGAAAPGWGGATVGWIWNSTMADSGINLWLIPHYTNYEADGNFPRQYHYQRYITAPGEVPLLADSNWFGSWPGSQPENDDLRPGPDEVDTGYVQHQHGMFMGRFVIARHGMSVNAGFVDGSARNVRLGELWALRWHRQFKPTHEYEDEYR
jgi:prepilin-type N-terminal cleavage/methylation domain-containing protein